MNNKHYNLIKENLKSMGVNKGDDILIHSSFKSLGYVEGGIKTLIDSIISYLGDRGTLLIPALTYENVTVKKPFFSAENTPTCVGAVSEYFRTYDGVKRSVHPSHSVCVYGYRQDEYVSNHYRDNTPVGPNSPFFKLPNYNGKILMLGCGLKPNTSMHGIEELSKMPYVLSKNKYKYILKGRNTRVYKNHYIHNIYENGFKQRYDRLENIMDIKSSKILEAQCYLIESNLMWKVASNKLKEDNFYFVEKR